MRLDERHRTSGIGLSKRPTMTTPRLLRVVSLVAVGAIAAAALVSFISLSTLASKTDRIDSNTGPVLIATQDVIASVAEADAASTGVFLSGAIEDREQRRLFEDALERATRQIEEVARLIGDDDVAHESLKTVSSQIVLYAGRVEAARLANQEGLDTADARLAESLTTVRDGILPEVDQITSRAQASLDSDNSGSLYALIAIAALVIASLVLWFGLALIRRRTNRLINLPVAVALVGLVGFAIWIGTATSARSNALERATEGGFASIALTARIQNAGFDYKTAETVGLIEGVAATELTELSAVLALGAITDAEIELARAGTGTTNGLLLDAYDTADSDRERAAAIELLIRWARYLDTSEAIEQLLVTSDIVGARGLAVTDGNTAFNGFNTAVESVLSDNRSQFTDSVAEASDAIGWLRGASIVIPVLAALLAMWGFQTRINEYR